MTALYPLALKLTHKKVLIVGAGKVALRKLTGLLDTGAEITVVSPEILPEIQKITQIKIIERPFESEDVKGFHIIYAATNQPAVNDSVAQNIEDWQWFDDTANPQTSSFYTPAVVRVDGLVVAISTENKDPVRAKSVKQKLTDFLLGSIKS
ncbi:NAD(P)-dependent oxidoreductase [Entomomonas moraniae]|uniref:precorrin-2 dehydrogenase n=1 Tax=Entomomonas moraniae TaxID=2213226 RepID=A0A3S9XBR4_9GAMM|nr:NAD(P)-dependent oxidoreductase [Entomomonas moraniae]AZS49857.1 NAD(P)-dependent oxidoreductase [Entomomonas moraniae]